MDEEIKVSNESYFDGGVLQRFGWVILGSFVTAITLGICYPIAINWLYGWEAKHTVINGRRLKFTGSGVGLLGTWIVCLLLTIVTLGIYGFYVPIKIRKWREANTFFEDEAIGLEEIAKLRNEKASYFDGGFWQLFGWELLGDLITIFTFGICYPWAVKMLYSWEQRHKVYNHRRCTFDGTAGGLFGTWLLCILLSVITLGIYTLWVPIKIKKWQIKHTHLLEDESPAEEQETKNLSEEDQAIMRLNKAKEAKKYAWISLIGIALVFLSLFVCFYSNSGILISAIRFKNPFANQPFGWSLLVKFVLIFQVLGILCFSISSFSRIVAEKTLSKLSLFGIVFMGAGILLDFILYNFTSIYFMPLYMVSFSWFSFRKLLTWIMTSIIVIPGFVITLLSWMKMKE